MGYSPDGSARGIWLMDADARNLRQISDGGGGGDLDPTWSPRDDAIAFTRLTLDEEPWGIRVAGLGGAPEVQITDRQTHSRHPAWRPAGDVIAYAERGVGGTNIHTMDSQGRPLRQLTDVPRYQATPSWHPRGTAIAFIRYDESGNNSDIYAMNADGTGERRLTEHASADRRPVWSPDGTQILLESLRDGTGQLYIMDLDGRVVRRLTDNGAQFTDVDGASWFDPDVPRSVSPVGRRATTWGWVKRLGTDAQ